MKRLFTIVSVVFLGMGLAHAEVLTLDDAVQRALANNPSVRAAHEEALAAKARIPQAITPENPTVGIEFEKTPINTLNIENAMSTNYQVRQTIPFPTKLISKGAAAKNEARAAKNNASQTEIFIISEVKKAYFDLLLIDKKMKIEREIQKIFNIYKGVAETKYATGVTLFDDPIKAGLESADIENNLNELLQERTGLAANLGYLLSGDLSDDIQLADVEEPSSFNYELAGLKELAAKNQPMLLAELFSKAAARNRLSEARQEYLPDIMAEFGYHRQKDLQNAWTGSLGISVPLWFFGRQQPAIREAKAEENAAAKNYEDTQNKLNYSLTSTYAQIKSGERILNTYKKTILPKARAALESVETSYTTGKTDFLNLKDSALKLREFEIDYWQTLTNLRKAIAEMEVLAGKQL